MMTMTTRRWRRRWRSRTVHSSGTSRLLGKGEDDLYDRASFVPESSSARVHNGALEEGSRGTFASTYTVQRGEQKLGVNIQS